MKNNTPKLSLHKPETYQITVPGVLDAQLVNIDSSLSFTSEENRETQPVSIITGWMDQATLHGLLRQLYGLGLPIISVICVECMDEC